MDATRAPGVLMVIGAYFPELSGGGLPCREIVRRADGRASFVVLTTTADPSLPEDDERDGVPVYRVRVDPASTWSKLRATVRMVRTFWRTRRAFSIVHLHGFSQKSILVVALAHLFGKRIVITLTSVGQDDPPSIRKMGRLAYWAYSQAEVFGAVSPGFTPLYAASSLRPDRLRLIPNSVDVERFRPVDAAGQQRVREALGLGGNGPIVLFVGFFSREKGPELAFEAFARVSADCPDARLVLIGRTRLPHPEIDPALAGEIRDAAARRGLADRIVFVESTLEIEKYFQAADVYILTSTREGLPQSLIEAMATGLGCIATRIEGVTDALLTDGITGRFVAPRDLDSFADALRALLNDRDRRQAMGARAREVVLGGFTVDRMVEAYYDIYQRLARRR